MPKPPAARPVALRIELLVVEPMVWRRVLVSNQWTLASLHHYLQWIMGWNDSHAHEFQIGADIVAPDWWLHEVGVHGDTRTYRDEQRVSVAAVVAQLGPRAEFEYHYDMGDGWEHRIVIESVPATAALNDSRLPLCVAGENACPPDDVGGPSGYADFVAALRDRDHDQHVDMVRWIGGAFDPAGFDLNHLNRDWKPGRMRRRR